MARSTAAQTTRPIADVLRQDTVDEVVEAVRRVLANPRRTRR